MPTWQGFSGPLAPGLPAPPSDFADRFTADYEATVATQLGRASETDMRSRAYQETVDKIYSVTGRKVDNPVWILDKQARKKAEDDMRAAWDQARGADASLATFPDIDARAKEMAIQRAQESAARAQVSVGLGGVGGFLGSTAGSMESPIQMLMLPYGGTAQGATWAARVVNAAATNAIVAGVTQIPVEAEAADWRRRLGLPDTTFANIAAATVGGGVLGGGFKAAGEALGALVRRPPPSVRDMPWYPVAEQAAREAGVPFNYIVQTAMAESGGRNISAATSSASGPWQFIRGTWAALGEKYPGLGLTAENRLDPVVQARAIASFTADNQAVLRRELGRNPEALELYGAHVFGPSRGSRLAEAGDNTMLIDVVGRDAIEANPSWNGWTVGQWRAKYSRRFSGSDLPQPSRLSRDTTDALRTVERAALDVDHAHGEAAAAHAHSENMVAAERSIADRIMPQFKELPEGAGAFVESPVGRQVATRREIAELSSLWIDEQTGAAERAVIGPDNRVEAGGDLVEALRTGSPEALAKAREEAAKSGLDTSGYVQPVVIERRLQQMSPEERATWMDEWRGAEPASDAAGPLTGADRADFAAAERVVRKADAEGRTVGELVKDGEPVSPGAMNWLRAMHADDGLTARAAPENVAAAAREFASPPRSEPGVVSSGDARDPQIARAAEVLQAETADAVKPDAVPALEAEARRQIADALTTRGDVGDVKIDIGDGREISLSDLDAELRRLEGHERAADIIEDACVAVKPAPKKAAVKATIARDPQTLQPTTVRVSGGGAEPTVNFEVIRDPQTLQPTAIVATPQAQRRFNIVRNSDGTPNLVRAD